MIEFNTSEKQSILKMNSLYISNFTFKRNENNTSLIKNTNPKFNIGKSISEITKSNYIVSLSLNAYSEDFNLSLTVSGSFSVEDIERNKPLIIKNSVSILFPYLRSQLTILTSQPNFEPIILPPININKLFEFETEQC